MIDSASGGGNFLNYSFECLFKLYKKTKPKWTNQIIVDTILNSSIVGYDLDSNLSKIASLSLFVKACGYAVPSKSIPIKIFGGIANDKLGFLNPNVTSNSIGRTTFKTQLEKLNKEKKIKVFVTNPPFMGKRDMDTSLKDYLLANYPESKGDLCVSFIQRTIQVMNEKDVSGVVSQNNWMYLSSLKISENYF
ncbi:MAG: N-6 DNA methylase [Bacteroidetes bacterium]|nr:N-6 DNA methylase [Bacteroidota bacterium]